MIYYGEIEYTSGYLGCQDVRERERVTVELRGTVGPYINNWLILHLVTGAGFVLPTGPKGERGLVEFKRPSNMIFLQ